jgi:NACalpha-BTF3-like transcription factor
MEKHVETIATRYDKDGLSITEARQRASTGDAAAVMYLQNKKQMDGRTYQNFNTNANSSITQNKNIMKKINDEMSKKDLHLVIQNEQNAVNNDEDSINHYIATHGGDRANAITNLQNEVVQNRFGNLDAKKIAELSNDFHRDANMQNHLVANVDRKVLREAAGKMTMDARNAWRSGGAGGLHMVL